VIDAKDEAHIPESGALRIPDALWPELRRRAEVIGPIAALETVSRSAAAEAARQLNVSQRTVYNFVKRWRSTSGSLTALASVTARGGRGQTRLPKEVDQLIASIIGQSYLSKQRISLSGLMGLIRAECRKAGLRAPSLNTVRARIERLHPEDVLRRRHGANAARRLQAVEGQFPVAEQPFDAVQIDHTRVDIIVVDPYTRQPIGRPWITIAIDAHTRCIPGICLTLEAPSATSVGLCLAHAATDKKPWLERIGVEAEWPMAGKPKVIHVDNGADFHSEALRRGCEAHGIRIVHRPVGAPHYGGIVERVIGTLMNMVHQLPGTTFSNPMQRAEYKSERQAAFTLAELEKWVALAITGPYHGQVHSGIGEPPIARWRRAMEHGGGPSRVSNPRSFLVDFLPVVRRRIQRQGFLIDHIVYSSNSIKPWIARRDRGHRFVIRRDPRDLSRIFVLAPEANYYVEVPYRSISRPAITLWEHRQAIDRVREEGRRQVDEASIFKAVAEMRSVAQKAVATTRAARRSLARRAHLPSFEETHPPAPPLSVTETPEPVKPFDEIEIWYKPPTCRT
jgi:putative transposase